MCVCLLPMVEVDKILTKYIFNINIFESHIVHFCDTYSLVILHKRQTVMPYVKQTIRTITIKLFPPRDNDRNDKLTYDNMQTFRGTYSCITSLGNRVEPQSTHIRATEYD